MSDDKRFYLTTPIYYVNDSPHIGHAYTTLACDALARFMRLDGYDVFFLTGTDEHGQKVEKSAQAAGIDPQAFTDRVSENFRELAKAMNFSNDAFIRTTEPRHARASQAIWQALMDNGHIYLGSYSGWYAVRDEAFYDESELTEGEDGIKRAPSGAEAEWVEEPSYFFDLSKWQDRLLAFYEANPDFIAPPSRRNEVVSFVKGGLKDLSVSRTSFKWGVPVPGDADHIMYVWLDALTNYATAVDYPDKDSQAFSTYWPCRSSHGGQGHPALSRGLLAGLPDGRGHRSAEAGLRARMVDQRGPEDLEIDRQHHRSVRRGRALRARPGALLPAARGSVRQ